MIRVRAERKNRMARQKSISIVVADN